MTKLVLILGLVATPALAQAQAFVYANAPSRAEYSPAAAYAHNPSGGPITIRRAAVGKYAVTFGGLSSAASGGNVQVSAYGSSPSQCKVSRWVPKGQDLEVHVLCFSSSQSVDSPFSLLFTSAKGGAEGEGPRFVWAGKPNAARYTAPEQYTQNAGRPVTIERNQAGVYDAKFTGVARAAAQGGNVQVTAYGNGNSFCKVERWTPNGDDLSVRVRCFDAGGRPSDSPFSLLFTPGAGQTTSAAPPPPPPPGPRLGPARLEPAGETAFAGNARGGRLFRDACPPGQVMVGVRAHVAGSLQALEVRCGALTAGADGRTVQVGAGRSFPARGRARGRPGTVQCPPNQVVVGFSGRSGQLVDRLGLSCAALRIGANGRVVVGAANAAGEVGSAGGRPFRDLVCRRGTVATAGLVRAGNSVDAFALGCSRVGF